MLTNGFTIATSRKVCRFDLRLIAIDSSASKNKSRRPANGLFGRRAPRATVWITPIESVHQETIKLVSLNRLFRRRIPLVLITRESTSLRAVATALSVARTQFKGGPL